MVDDDPLDRHIRDIADRWGNDPELREAVTTDRETARSTVALFVTAYRDHLSHDCGNNANCPGIVAAFMIAHQPAITARVMLGVAVELLAAGVMSHFEYHPDCGECLARVPREQEGQT